MYDIKLRPGMRYAPHPAFAKKSDGSYAYFPVAAAELQDKYAIPDFPLTGTRDLTADDYVYAIRRLASPRVVSPIYSLMAEYVHGLKDYGDRLRLRDQALRRDAPGGAGASPWLDLREADGFDGVQALDPLTLRIRVNGKYPQFKYWLAMTFTAPIPGRPTALQPARHGRAGPVVQYLARGHRPLHAGGVLAEPPPRAGAQPELPRRALSLRRRAGRQAAGLLADCGKPTPFIDRAVFNVEKEAIPLTGKFLQGYYDVPQIERGEYGVAMLVAAGDSQDKARKYREHGIKLPTTVETANWYMGFNWLDPVVGKGDTPEQADRNRKLRQAISIAFDWEEYVAVFENSQASVAYGPVPPGVLGYREPPEGVNPVVYDLVDGKPVRKPIDVARRLLAEAGYPDGRNARTGAPLVLYYDSMTGGGSSPQFDWMRRQLAKLGVQLDVRATDYNRFQDKMRRGSAQIFFWGWNADYPDAENFLFLLYGPNAKAKTGGENAANYDSPSTTSCSSR